MSDIATLKPLDAIAQVLLEDFELESTFLPLEFMGKECDAIICKYFAIIEHAPRYYYITFCLNYCGFYEVAFFSHILTLLLGNEMHIFDDHYMDIKEGRMYFGDAAHLRNLDVINTKRGLKQCTMCDKYLPVEFFKDKDFCCIICAKMVLPNVKFH